VPSWQVIRWTLLCFLPIVSCLLDQKRHRDTFFCEYSDSPMSISFH
jgi:hypothetical protein